MKRITKLLGVCFSAFAILGVSLKTTNFKVASAASSEKLYKRITFGSSYNSKPVNGYNDTFDATRDDFTLRLENFNNARNGWNYVKAGNKTEASVATMTTLTKSTAQVTSVSLNISANPASEVKSISLYSGYSAEDINTLEGTYTIKLGTQKVSISDPVRNSYFKIVVECDKGTFDGLLTISEVVFNQRSITDDQYLDSLINFENITTKSSLGFSYSIDNEDITINSVDLRFGGIVPKQDFENCDFVYYGVWIGVNDYLYIEDYESLNEIIDDMDNSMEDAIDLSEDFTIDTRVEVDHPYECGSDGTTGSGYYMWNLKVTIPSANYSDDINAIAYAIDREGDFYRLKEIKMSAKSLAGIYNDSDLSKYSEEVRNAINALDTYETK